MVWALFPVDPLPGELPYYIYSKGTYKVGRKGCDIIVNKDKGVSRIHAEIVVDEMMCLDQSRKKSSNNSSKIRIRDCSKYGTFINKDLGSKKNVQEFPDKETVLSDGDLVSFGTGNANYRFSFVSLIFFASSSKRSEINQLQDKISLIGASMTRTWSLQCTHVVIGDFTSVNDEIMDAIVAKKPLVKFSWIELVAGKNICTEIPSYLSHTPQLTLEGLSFKAADPQSREHCLEGYTFLLESIHKYQFKKKLPLLLEVSGAKVDYAKTQDSCTQGLGDHLVCVMPAGTASNTNFFLNFNSQPKVKERDLVSAVVSGLLDPSIITSAPVLVTSSCSTDETVVADSDVEMETATSAQTSVAINLIESDEEDEHMEMEKIPTNKVEAALNDGKAESLVHNVESSEPEWRENTNAIRTIEHESLKPDCSYKSTVKSDNVDITFSRDIKDGIRAQKDRGDSSESENLDIIYSQNLIVRESKLPQSGHFSRNSEGITDFKLFRKTGAPSGNSFSNLIPFAKNPYEEADYGNEDAIKSVKEEKKRKQMEAIAEDLFNNQKVKKRSAAAGPLRGLFARG